MAAVGTERCTPPVQEFRSHSEVQRTYGERITALETQIATQDRTIRKLLKMAAAFLDSETP